MKREKYKNKIDGRFKGRSVKGDNIPGEAGEGSEQLGRNGNCLLALIHYIRHGKRGRKHP